MLPVVAGRAATTRQILIYSAPPGSGLGSALGARVCGDDLWRDRRDRGALFLLLAFQLNRSSGADRRAPHRFFVFSIFYLFVLFAALLVDQGGNSFSPMRSSHDGRTRRGSACMPNSCQAQFAAHTCIINLSRRGLTCDTVYLPCPDRCRDTRWLHRRRARSERADCPAERQILFNALGIMLAIVIPTILATLGVGFWFRASNSRALLAGFRVFRASRAAGLVDPRHDGAARRRRRMGRRTRP